MKRLLVALSLLVVATVALAGPLDKYVLNSNSDGDVIFRVNDGGVPTDVVTVDGATSSVGIGVSSPLAPLHVLGPVRLRKAGNQPEILFTSTNSTSGQYSTRIWTDVSSDTSGDIMFDTSTTLNAGKVTSTGAWTLGSSGVSSTHTLHGTTHAKRTSAGAGTGADNDFVTIVETQRNSSGLSYGLLVRSDTSSNPSGENNLIEVRNAATTKIFRVSNNGVMTVGAAGANNSVHRFNGVVDWVADTATATFEHTDTTPSGNTMLQMFYSGSTDANGASFIAFRDSNNQTGSIGANSATSVAYNTTSDARLKKDVVDLPNGLAKVLAMQPRQYKWTEDSHVEDGFLAQELKVVYPQVVSGSPDGDPQMAPMQVDYGKLTPVLAQAIKELKAELDAVKAEFAAYKASHP